MKLLSTRRRLLATTVLCAVAAFASGASAADTDTVEELIVTGSRIARVDTESAVPVQVIGEERIEQQGYENVVDVLTTLPQFAASFGASRTQSTFSGAASSGLNLTNLRNLGSNRSVTLINGRRAPAGNIVGSGVDFNTIPSANISRVEVLTGGAAAIYGADAVAGVVNIITDTKFDGLEMGASYGLALAEKDNINPSAFIRFGKAFDKGHLGATLQYDYQGFVSCADRYLCEHDFVWNPPAAVKRGAGTSPADSALSGVPPQGRFLIGAGNGLAAGDFTQRNGSFTDSGGALIPFTLNLDGYDRNPKRALAIPTERVMFATDASYEVLPWMTAFLEMNYGSSKTQAPFEGHPFQSTTDLLGSLPVAQGGLEASIPTTNPFIPAALRARAVAAGDNEISWLERFDQLGLRGANNQRQTMRIAAGVTGQFDTLAGIGSNWNYEASYVWGRTTLDSVTNGLVARDRLYNGLRVEQVPGAPAGTYRCTDPVARASGCVPLNPFAAFTPAMANYISVNAGQRGETELENGLAFLGGSLFDLPAGPLQVGVGLESRRTTAFLDYDDPINRGLVTGNRTFDNPEATFRTNEAYIEARAPLLKDLPFIESLNVEGAFRWSDSSNFGKYETWKIGGDWSPVPGLRLRVMKNKAVRAPVLSEYNGGSQTAGNINDPCATERYSANATRAANCLSAGIPSSYNPATITRQGVTGFVLGNSNLVPEEAETLTYGLVFNGRDADYLPSVLQPLVVTVDRFQIDIQKVITTTGRQTIADLCYDLSGAARAQYCALVTRGFSQIEGVGYALQGVNDTVDNLGGLDVRGVDLQVDYGFQLGDLFGDKDIGRVNFNAVMTFYDKADELVAGSTIDLLGSAGGSTSDAGFLKKQGNFTTSYSNGGLKVNWVARWIPKTKMSPFAAAAVPEVPAYWYHDVQARYSFNDAVEVYGGVSNLLDKDPPFFASGTAGTQALDTIPAYYDIFGRQAYVGFKLRF
ncbi:TonB-dependent receptor [Phenylobacterium sp. 20VBR1]|uniref:TonB-dependent receptor n=1 Tax=Phenylobacterium glaciei TaxID=2803784 RepID=A0A941D486_9CAUL|nr:TonB-dependent receptor [Phenylobacterium glaciei]